MTVSNIVNQDPKRFIVIQLRSGVPGVPDDLLINFFADGTVEYGPTYTEEAAARVFWENLPIHNPLLVPFQKAQADLSLLRLELARLSALR